jgi:MoCo/4Fe-4S cofactor protein with predicted Tat translocation signal
MPSKDTRPNFEALREKILSTNGKEYWRSIDELADTPEFEEFVKREYPVHSEDWDTAFSRRSFVKLMGGTLALAGLSGCVIQPPEKIVPRVRDQEDMLPGKSMFFATAMTMGGIATGLLAESYEGRPIKLEGNPEHPGSLGTTDVFAQAALLDMYDPDRSQNITLRGNQSTWQNFSTSVRSSLDEARGNGGAGIRFLSETVTSPTLQAQMRQIASELPNSRWYQYEPVNSDNAMAGARLAFGSPVHTVYRFDVADRILTLDKDIFTDFNVRYKRDYAKRKNYSEQNKQINRLYAVETTITPTGAKADHRLAVKPSQVAEVARAVAAAVGVGGATSAYTENAQWIAALARDLMAHHGRSIVVAGDSQPPIVHAIAHAINGALGNVGQTVVYTEPLVPFAERTQAEQLRELITDIDAGRVTMLVILGGNPVYNTPADLKLNRERMEKVPLRVHLGTHMDETGELCHWHIPQKHFLETWGDARAYDGTVTLIQPLIERLYDSRSIYEVAQLFFREDFDKRDIDIVKQYWQTQNISAARPTAAVAPQSAQPAATAANAASAGQAGNSANGATAANTAGTQAGTTSGSATAPSATNTAPATTTPEQRSPAPVQRAVGTGAAAFEDNWRRSVHDGFIANSAAATRNVTVNTAFLTQPQQPTGSGALEIAIRPDPTLYDGRFANNGWLQELPKPINKITWDMVALVSPNTARTLGLNQANDTDEISGGERPTSFINSKGTNMFADLVTLTYQGSRMSATVPVWITPGQPDGAVTIFMGGGRTRGGRIGTGIGYNAFEVMRSDAMGHGAGELAKTGEQTTIASTQIHFNMEGRDLLRVWDVNDIENEIASGKQEDFYPLSMYHEAYKNEYKPQYDTHNKWGMAIDLNSCVGCNACVIACQAENNIPVVGKEQVERSREMHWLRIDTYFGGSDVNNPGGTHFQPVLCMQCEQAPCEVVCPVTATVHNAEGLNDMVYNRCVGTRYCSNNCPYKVRRFNFLLYQDWDTPQYKLMRNPEVSIRSRGVMEKCTYCTQRISAARIEAQKEGRPIQDGEVVTACQAVCPTDAIVFGDLNDKNSQVWKIKQDPRNYNLLNELNTQPRTTYLAELKNQNSEMPDYRPPTPKAQKVHKEGKGSGGSEDH